jgi:CubicO group peptidase (beta-lactamase class C family)
MFTSAVLVRLAEQMTILARFAIAFMAGGGGTPGGREVLRASTVKKPSTPYTPFNTERAGDAGDYGYGVRIYSHRGLRVVEHGGQHPGGGSLLFMVPEKGFAAIILANRSGNGRLYDVVDVAIDLLLDASPRPVVPPESEVAIEAAEMEHLRGPSDAWYNRSVWLYLPTLMRRPASTRSTR